MKRGSMSSGQSSGATFINSTPRLVTLATFGLQTFRYPGTDPKPQQRYGTVRNHDHSQSAHSQVMVWRDIQTGVSTYKYDGPDAWFNQRNTDGVELLWTFMGTPDFLVTPGPFGSGTDTPAYGGKSNCKPDSMSAMADHVTVMVNRYKDRCKLWQFGNEPNLNKFHHTSSWAATDLVNMQRLCYQAAKAEDPTCTVLSPPYTSVFSGVTGLNAFLAASDGAGGTGKDWFDVLAYHYYCNDTSDRPHGLIRMHKGILNAMKTVGISKPIFATETGLIKPYMDTYTAEKQARLARNYLVTLLALGVERICWYQDGNSQMALTGGAITAWNEVADACIGRMILRAEVKMVSQQFLESTLWLDNGVEIRDVYGPMSLEALT